MAFTGRVLFYLLPFVLHCASGNSDLQLFLNFLYQRTNTVLYGTYVKISLRAGIFKHSMGARNRVGIGLSYRPAGQHRLAELIP
jgi:hypothetical protein